MARVKKIDVHCHVTVKLEKFTNHYHDNTPFLTAEEQIAIYDALDVEMGVNQALFCPEFAGSPVTNENCRATAENNPDRFSWFCYVDPRSYKEEYGRRDLSDILNDYKQMGAKGVGEFVPNLYFDDPLIDKFFSHCEEVGMPLLFHISPALGFNYGLVDELHLPRFEKMLKKHKDLIFLGHSQPFWAEMGADLTQETRNMYPTTKVVEGRIPKLMREYGNLICDLSAGSGSNALRRDPEYAAKFVEEFSDRIVYGCDICSRNDKHFHPFNDFLNDMTDRGMISEENYAKIARENAIRILGLKLK